MTLNADKQTPIRIETETDESRIRQLDVPTWGSIKGKCGSDPRNVMDSPAIYQQLTVNRSAGSYTLGQSTLEGNHAANPAAPRPYWEKTV